MSIISSLYTSPTLSHESNLGAFSGVNIFLGLSIPNISIAKWYSPPSKSSGPLMVISPVSLVHPPRKGSVEPKTFTDPLTVGLIFNFKGPSGEWKRSLINNWSSFSTDIKYETNLIVSSVFASNNLNSKNAFSLLSEVKIGGLILV